MAKIEREGNHPDETWKNWPIFSSCARMRRSWHSPFNWLSCLRTALLGHYAIYSYLKGCESFFFCRQSLQALIGWGTIRVTSVATQISTWAAWSSGQSAGLETPSSRVRVPLPAVWDPRPRSVNSELFFLRLFFPLRTPNAFPWHAWTLAQCN